MIRGRRRKDNMKERPIIFSAPMIQAILAGRKTQTRRIVKPQPETLSEWRTADGTGQIYDRGWLKPELRGDEWHFWIPGLSLTGWKCPYGAPGDRLWVKERFYIDHISYADGERMPTSRPKEIDEWMIYYPADARREPWCCDLIAECACGEVGKPKVRGPLYMPRWASRITLEVVSVRVERVQEITLDDAIAEGCERHLCTRADTESCKPGTPVRALAELLEGGYLTELSDFQRRWDVLNAKRGSWARNPWVWAVEFKCATVL